MPRAVWDTKTRLSFIGLNGWMIRLLTSGASWPHFGNKAGKALQLRGRRWSIEIKIHVLNCSHINAYPAEILVAYIGLVGWHDRSGRNFGHLGHFHTSYIGSELGLRRA